MRSFAFIVTSALALMGCSKGLAAGSFTGDLVETCNVNQTLSQQGSTAKVQSSTGGNTTNNYVLALAEGATKGQLETTIKGCKIAFQTMPDGKNANVTSTGCDNVSLGSYTGKAMPSGSLSLQGDEKVSLTVNLNASAPGTGGGCTYALMGTRTK